MGKFIKVTALIILYCIIVVGLAFVYSNTIQPSETYLRFWNIFPIYQANLKNAYYDGLSVRVSKEKVRIHKKSHNEDEVLLCEERNDLNCFLSCSLLILPLTEDCHTILIDGNLPKEGEIAVCENLADLLDLTIGDSVVVKNFLNFNKYKISGIIENANGFPEEYSRYDYAAVVENSNTNWTIYQPFDLYHLGLEESNFGKISIGSFFITSRELVVFKWIFKIIIVALLLFVCFLSKEFLDLNQFLLRQRILGKKDGQTIVISLLYDSSVILILGSVLCVVCKIYELDVKECFPVIMISLAIECGSIIIRKLK